jgi:hypothetical protein
MISVCFHTTRNQNRTVRNPPMSGHLASSQHRREADTPSQPASLRDGCTGNGSRRSRGPTGLVSRAPRRRHLSPTVRAANRPRAAGLTETQGPGEARAAQKAPLPMAAARKRGARQNASAIVTRRAETLQGLGGADRRREPKRSQGRACWARSRARSRPKVRRRYYCPC